MTTTLSSTLATMSLIDLCQLQTLFCDKLKMLECVFPCLPSSGMNANKSQYDMITTPITTPHFQSRVLSLILAHLSEASQVSTPAQSARNKSKSIPSAPIIPPLLPADTPLTPGDTVSQLIAYSSPWIDLCSPDPLISNLSRQVLNIEIAYASFCGVGNIIIPGPRSYGSGEADSDGLAQYARAIQEALTIGSYIQIAIQIPMYGYEEVRETKGDLSPFARDLHAKASAKASDESVLFETWDAWNTIRSVCKYSSRLSVGEKLTLLSIFAQI